MIGFHLATCGLEPAAPDFESDDHVSDLSIKRQWVVNVNPVNDDVFFRGDEGRSFYHCSAEFNECLEVEMDGSQNDDVRDLAFDSAGNVYIPIGSEKKLYKYSHTLQQSKRAAWTDVAKSELEVMSDPSIDGTPSAVGIWNDRIVYNMITSTGGGSSSANVFIFGQSCDQSEADDIKAKGIKNVRVKVVDAVSELKRRGVEMADCSTVDCKHRANSAGINKSDGSCKCACDGTSQYEKDSVCIDATVCSGTDVVIVNATRTSDRICGARSIADKKKGMDSAGAALSDLVSAKLKEQGLSDADAFNLAVDMVGGVNKC